MISHTFMKRYIVYALVFLVFTGICGCSRSAGNPRQAFDLIKEAVLESDWNLYWRMLSAESHRKFEQQVKFMHEQFKTLNDDARQRVLASMGLSEEEFQKLDGKRFFISYMSRNQQRISGKSYTRDLFETCTVLDIDLTGDGNTAFIIIEDNEGHQEKLPAVREDDGWKLDFSQFYSF